MVDPIADAFRILGHFWLEEIQPCDLETIAALPELATAVPGTDAPALADLAMEYQRLLGFNLPPYESIFIDPSAMLLAPATTRVQALYRQGYWVPPVGVRVAGPDHLGLELLALAAGLADGRDELARRLQTQHLALWVPPFVQALQRLAPQPFYARLGDLTLALLLETLPGDPIPPLRDPFPVLPPAPIYQGAGMAAPLEDEAPLGLRDIVRRLLTPREAGFFLTRVDIARLSRVLHLPGVTGERARMLETLFRLAGQYDLIVPLIDRLSQLVEAADITYRDWVEEYPRWSAYAEAWQQRLAATRANLAELCAAIGEAPR